METYTALIDKAAALRKTLAQVSQSASEFGQALEDCVSKCPKVNNPRPVCDGLINAGGLQYMIGSNQQILSRLVQTSFEDPLREQLQKLELDYKSSYGFYQQEVKQKSRALREKELENIKLSKQRTRNLNTYKHNLLNLTNQLDEIDRLKYDYYHEINSMIEKFYLEQLLLKTGSLVRAQLEIYEGIAKKGWSGGGLDDLLAVSPDLFEVKYSDTEGDRDVSPPIAEELEEEGDDTVVRAESRAQDALVSPEELFSLPTVGKSSSLLAGRSSDVDSNELGESDKKNILEGLEG